MILLTDIEIRNLIVEPKQVKSSRTDLFDFIRGGGSVNKSAEVAGLNGNQFRLMLRRTSFNLLDFSAILGYVLPNNRIFRLRRYNGKSHEHRNTIENTPKFYNFHIHEATARYQQIGNKDEESFAKETNRYGDLSTAIQCLIADCNISFPDDTQLSIFGVIP